MKKTGCTETSACEIQMPINYPEESIQQSERGKCFKTKGSYSYNIIFSIICSKLLCRASSDEYAKFSFTQRIGRRNIHLNLTLEISHIRQKCFGKRVRGVNILYDTINPPNGPGPPHYRGFTITLRHTTLCRNPLDEWSDRRRDLCRVTHNSHKWHPCSRRDSNQQSQQARNRRPTLYTARPLWPTNSKHSFLCSWIHAS
jgi:hypothetical protein